MVAANIISLSHGCILGWLSPFLPLLQSTNSPLESGAITLVEASWVAAIICFGGVIGNFTFGLLANHIGSKRAICLLAFPQMVKFPSQIVSKIELNNPLFIYSMAQAFWLCIMFGRYVQHLYIARIFAGITGGGIFVCIPLFVAEISDDQ